MADNTVLPVGAGGDTVRTIDRTGVKTQVVTLDFGGEAGPEALITLINGLPVQPQTGSTWAITATSLPLPTGAATGAKQDTGNTSLASLDTKLPPQGQALGSASVPVVLPAAQITTLTPPAAITGYALEAGHLATIDANTPTLGQKVMAGSQPVVLASDQTLPLPTNAVQEQSGNLSIMAALARVRNRVAIQQLMQVQPGAGFFPMEIPEFLGGI
jgi:hypothetical protein